MDTLGQRIMAIRDAMPRERPMVVLSRASFVGRLSAALGRDVSEGALADWENNRTEPSLDVIKALAVLDPLRRGPAWIAWGDAPTSDGGELHGAKPYPHAPGSIKTADQAIRDLEEAARRERQKRA